MTRHLVALSFGPVQSLIGAARRTRDLWCGSTLDAAPESFVVQNYYLVGRTGRVQAPAPKEPARREPVSDATGRARRRVCAGSCRNRALVFGGAPAAAPQTTTRVTERCKQWAAATEEPGRRAVERRRRAKQDRKAFPAPVDRAHAREAAATSPPAGSEGAGLPQRGVSHRSNCGQPGSPCSSQ